MPYTVQHDGSPRPAWIKPDDQITSFDYDRSAGGAFAANGKYRADQIGWQYLRAFTIPDDHWAVPALRVGLTPWQGGENAPDDWDGGDVLLRDGRTIPGIKVQYWHQRSIILAGDIIGYRKRSPERGLQSPWPDPTDFEAGGAPASVFDGQGEHQREPFNSDNALKLIDQATANAKHLAMAIHDKHYAGDTTWQPSDDLITLIDQIDNMTAGLTTPPDSAASATHDDTVRADAIRECIERVKAWGGFKVDRDEAVKALTKLLPPEPVDPDLIEARRLAWEHTAGLTTRPDYRQGDNDQTPVVQAILAGIKHGRGE